MKVFNEIIMLATANVLGIKKEDIITDARKGESVKGRQLYMGIVKYLFPKTTLEELGRPFGFHHANVIHHLKKFEIFLEQEMDYRITYEMIMSELNSSEFLSDVIFKKETLIRIQKLEKTINILINKYPDCIKETNETEMFYTYIDEY